MNHEPRPVWGRKPFPVLVVLSEGDYADGAYGLQRSRRECPINRSPALVQTSDMLAHAAVSLSFFSPLRDMAVVERSDQYANPAAATKAECGRFGPFNDHAGSCSATFISLPSTIGHEAVESLRETTLLDLG